MNYMKEDLIKHIFESACGYGMADVQSTTNGSGYDEFKQCMYSIPDEYFDDFIYTLRRVAEKSGEEGFEI